MKKFKILFSLIAIALMLFGSSLPSVKAQQEILQGAKSAILITDSGNILYEKNCDEKQPIASIVKLMTLKVVFDNIENKALSIDDEIVVSEYASSMGGSQMFLDANSTHKLGDIMKGVIVASANDGAVVLAETVAGSEKNFVDMMNKKASEMGLTNTYFTDCSGLSSDHYSTAKDVATLASSVLTNNIYQSYSNIWLENYIHPSGRVTELSNTNRLIRFFSGCDAGKTGSTDEAGYCLVATAKREDMRLISVVLGEKTSSDRFSESKDVLNYGFNHFESKTLLKSREVCQTVSIKKHHKPVDLYPQKDVKIVSKKGDEINYTTEFEIINQCAPIKKGEVVGYVKVISDGEVLTKVNLVTNQDVEKSNVFEIADNLIKNWKI